MDNKVNNRPFYQYIDKMKNKKEVLREIAYRTIFLLTEDNMDSYSYEDCKSFIEEWEVEIDFSLLCKVFGYKSDILQGYARYLGLK